MAEITYDYFTMYETGGESFQMWQGRVGPYYLPSVSPEGVLSFTNNGSLPNPAPVNIRGPVGQGIQISGVAETYEELPDDANQGDVWLVGTEYPLEGWVWLGAWMNIGPQGPQGQQGAVFTPEVDEEGNISWTNDGGLPNPETVNIMGPQGEQGEQGETGPAGPGVADGGTTGQVLKKASDDDYDTSWQPLNAGEILYADDGGYASGTVGKELGDQKNTLNQLAKYKVIGNNVSLSALKTALLSEASALNTAGLKSELVMFTCIDSPFASSLPVDGYLTIFSNIYFSCMASDSKGNVYILSYYNGTWFIDTLVPQSNALKYGEATAKIANTVTVPSDGAVVEVPITNSTPIPLSRVKYVLSCVLGLNPAAVYMSVAQSYNGNTGILAMYMQVGNAQTINAGTDVIIKFIYV